MQQTEHHPPRGRLVALPGAVRCTACGAPVHGEVPYVGADGAVCADCVDAPRDDAITDGAWREALLAAFPAFGAFACVATWQSQLLRVDVQVALGFCGVLALMALGTGARRLVQWRSIRDIATAELALRQQVVTLGAGGVTTALGVAGVLLATYGLLLPVLL